MKINYFNFKEFDGQILITNDFGFHLFLTREEFQQFLQKKFELNSDLGKRLIENNFVYLGTKLEYSASRIHDIRRIKNHLTIATSLHIFVVTTACNMQCVYCQANNGGTYTALFMTKETAKKAVDIALESPARYLSFEFQGGEPLLNFDVVKFIVEYAESKKGSHEIKYTIVSNLTIISEDIIDFFSAYNFGISTSIDGQELVHNTNRPLRDGNGSFSAVVEGIQKVRTRGLSLGAIQTTTKFSLLYPKEIVRTYYSLGFDSIFLRPLTPLGKAGNNWDSIGYTPDEFIQFYSEALDELIVLNIRDRFLKEEHAAIFLRKIYGNFVNYMELRSPCGAGVGQLAYYADGNVFTCDEGRMLYEAGDNTFQLGNVFENTYDSLINNVVCKTVCASSILEALPTCCDCAYQPYCGTCPVVNYKKSHDIIEKEPNGYRCKLYSGMLDYLFRQLLNGNDSALNVLQTWSN